MQAHVLVWKGGGGEGEANEVYIRADKMTSRRLERGEHTERRRKKEAI